MKSDYFPYIVIAIVMGLIATPFVQDYWAISEGKKLAASSLKDPDSAKFKDVILHEGLLSTNVCGSVNGKNSYGAYSGFTRFIVTNEKVLFEKKPGVRETKLEKVLRETFVTFWDSDCRD